MTQQPSGQQNWWLIIGVIGLIVGPLVFVRNAEFAGADAEAITAVAEIEPNYQPWFQPLIQPASSEIASLLFASQAALGAGMIGYAIGFYKGRSTQHKRNRDRG
ncbi:MAG: energy-coupling factor ABC transporter substrate-binding protein [Cyanobacteria bacterium RM1_2_2]|nr:energy-coupling factor ABC transporter substrate-binding protein [Cyanobacteria bacterium RM1_2_2]